MGSGISVYKGLRRGGTLSSPGAVGEAALQVPRHSGGTQDWRKDKGNRGNKKEIQNREGSQEKEKWER